MSSELKTEVNTKLNTKKNSNDIFAPVLITRKVHIPIVNIGANIEETIRGVIATEIEGKCIKEGYIKRDSIDIITYSSGLINSSNISFEVICPISPWLALDASKKKDGIPIDENVAAHFLLMIPLLPTPEIIILPFLQFKIVFII